jgi:peptidoglycan hydrolase CwlO-like protein
MYPLISTVLIVGTVVSMLIMVWLGKKITAPMIFAIGAVAIAGSWAISNLNLASLRMAPGSLSAEIQHVDMRADQVDAVAERVEGLAKAIDSTKKDVNSDQQRVAQLVEEANRTKDAIKLAESNIQRTSRAMLVPNTVMAAPIASVWGILQPLHNEIKENIASLATSAYPDANERNRVMEKLKAEMPGQFWK